MKCDTVRQRSQSVILGSKTVLTILQLVMQSKLTNLSPEKEDLLVENEKQPASI